MKYNNKLYQIKGRLNARKIVIEEKINGTKIMTYKNKVLSLITSSANKQQKPVHDDRKKGQKYIPSADHPWNNAKYG